jgi:hypothetical protein
LIVGSLDETLPEAASRWPNGAALVHSDIGTGDRARNRRVANDLSRRLPPLLMPGGIVVSDQPLSDPALETVPLPLGVAPDRYFIYRRA